VKDKKRQQALQVYNLSNLKKYTSQMTKLKAEKNIYAFSA